MSNFFFKKLSKWNPEIECFSNRIYNALNEEERKQVRNICNKESLTFSELAFRFHLKKNQVIEILKWFEDEKLKFQGLIEYKQVA